MKKLLQILGAALAISLIGMGLTLIPGTPNTVRAGRPDEVIVTNTPLPVQGTVNVGNFPASNTVSGTVSITGTPNVNVTNSASNPIPVQSVTDPGAQPFQVSLAYNASSNTNSFFVPTNKRLTLDYVAAEIQVSPGVKVLMSVVFDGCGSQCIINPPSVLQAGSFSGSDIFVVNQQIHVTVEPGKTISCSAVESAPTSTFAGSCFLSGHFTDVP